jgi:hypothetical protein
MAKKMNVKKDIHFKALLVAIKQFHKNQPSSEGFKVKSLVLTGGPLGLNCECKGPDAGKTPEIFIDPRTGQVTCRCV